MTRRLRWLRPTRDRGARVALGVGAPRLRPLDWTREATLSVTRHPGRSLLTALGTVLGATAFVTTLGVSSTLGQQVSTSFDLRRATEVVVTPDQPGSDLSWQDEESLTRLRSLNGVVDAGRRLQLGQQPVARGLASEPEPFLVFGLDAGALAAVEPRLVTGRRYDRFHDQHATRVVMLTRSVAQRLSIARVGAAVFIHDRAFTVVGIFDDVGRRTDLLQGVLIPAAAAEALLDAGPVDATAGIQYDVVASTAPGAAPLIGSQAATALHPEDPGSLRVVAPPDPRTLRREIEADVTRSALLLSVTALVIGAVSIASAATASITARVPEIGLRRALGARPAHIFVQLIGETTALGAVGGVVGVVAGVTVVAVVSLANTWSPVLDLRSAGFAAAASAAAGLLAGLWPAWQATRIQPVAALQR
jgi:putative ABC transport system permease protein